MIKLSHHVTSSLLMFCKTSWTNAQAWVKDRRKHQSVAEWIYWCDLTSHTQSVRMEETHARQHRYGLQGLNSMLVGRSVSNRQNNRREDSHGVSKPIGCHDMLVCQDGLLARSNQLLPFTSSVPGRGYIQSLFIKV